MAFRRRFMLTPALAGLAALLSGCSAGPSRAQVTPSQFKGTQTASAAEPSKPTTPESSTLAIAERPAAAPVKGTDPAASPTITAAAARERVPAVRAEPGAPKLAPTASPRGEPELIDAKLGDVNNRAIYASGFIKPLEAALKAKAAELIKKSPRTAQDEWREYAMEQVARALQGFIQDEVFRAEGMASLKPEQRQGLRAYMERLRDDEIRKNRGSLVLANEATAAREGVSLDEYMRKQEQREIIKYELSQRIYNRVQVPWRDIKLQYEKDYNRYNPKPEAVLRMILVPKKDAAGVQAITDALAAGTPFAEVTMLAPNLLAGTKAAGVSTVQFEGELATTQIYDDDGLNKAAQSLTEGKFAGPVDTRSNVAWICLESVRHESTTLYDAQLRIENDLYEQRRDREIGRFVGKLRSRASVTDVVEMGERLMQYAEERCFLPVLRGDVVAPPVAPAKDAADSN